MSCVWMLQRGNSGDGCVLASTLCKYDLRKGDLFVLSWATDNSLQAVELSGHQTCKLLSSHPFKPFPRRFSGSESVCSG